jgi:hypothetical protein
VITAVDTNVILDVLTAGQQFGQASRMALHGCRDDGRLVACDVVWAEVAAAFDDVEAVRATLSKIGLEYSPTPASAAELAGLRWRAYRRSGGPRERLVGDFLIGAYSEVVADRLLTRDRGFYRHYFSHVLLLDPSSPGQQVNP